MLVISKTKNQEGFSVLEIIAVLAIITVGMIGVLSLMTQNVQAEYVNKSALIASQLAQEGLELVRNIRDTNWYASGADWFDSFADNTGTFTYRIDGSGITPSDMANAGLNIVGGYYSHQPGTPSIFSRLLTITRSDTGSSTVSCRVFWTERNMSHNYTAETVLYDWKQN